VAYLDRPARRLDLKVVYWGPARGGKTTSLRSLHGAFTAADRGEMQSVETADEQTYFFDYAPLELPRYRDLTIRVHAYTVPGQDVYVETRRRILRGADGVLFVADATPTAAEANVAAWRQLDEELTRLDAGRRAHPVVVTVNKLDLPGARAVADVVASLTAAVPTRAIVDVVGTSALLGRGVGRSFRRTLTAAAAHALADEDTAGAVGVRSAFLEALDAHLARSDDGAPVDDGAAARRSVVVTRGPAGPDAAGLEVALDAARQMNDRDQHVRDLRRQQALSKLLLEVGRLCLEATDPAELARGVLTVLVRDLGGTAGWVGLPDAVGGEHVFDARGRARDAAALSRTVRVLLRGVAADASAPLEFPPGVDLSGVHDGRRGLLSTFSAGGGKRGWLLVLGTVDRDLCEGATSVCEPAGAFVGLTLGRLAANARLQETNGMLERRVEERTLDLRRERDSLEARVRERTAELEAAKHAAVEAERRILDLERTEGVQRLAAGLAHELNNPLGAACANLDFAEETLEALLPSLADDAREEVRTSVEAVTDAKGELRKVTANLTSLFDGATAARRAAVRTPLAPVVREAIAAHVRVHAGVVPPVLEEKEPVACGVPPAECSRWVFRLLGAVARVRVGCVRLAIDRSEDGPRVTLTCGAPLPAPATHELELLRAEVERAGGVLRAGTNGARASVVLLLPRAVGEVRGTTAREGVR
jgi:signal recognition particle receptor subunit beta